MQKRISVGGPDELANAARSEARQSAAPEALTRERRDRIGSAARMVGASLLASLSVVVETASALPDNVRTYVNNPPVNVPAQNSGWANYNPLHYIQPLIQNVIDTTNANNAATTSSISALQGQIANNAASAASQAAVNSANISVLQAQSNGLAANVTLLQLQVQDLSYQVQGLNYTLNGMIATHAQHAQQFPWLMAGAVVTGVLIGGIGVYLYDRKKSKGAPEKKAPEQ